MSEKNSRNGRKGGFVPGEKEPLFPRLHVNSAGEKKGGPRAPPRNKMALYEQLSVPSHRFQQPSTPSATQMQGSSFEGRYSFCPVNFTPSPDASGSDACYDQSASVVTRDSAAGGNKQFHRVPTIISSTAMGSSYDSDKSKNQRNLPGKKVRDDDDFKVPQCSNSRISNSSTTEPCIIDKFQTVENFTTNATKSSTSSSNTFQWESTRPISSDSDSWKKCTQADSKDCTEIKDHLQQINCSASLNAKNDCSVSHQLLGNSSSVAPVLTSGQNTIRENHLIGTEYNGDSVKWVGLSSNATLEGLLLANNNNNHREESVQVADINDKREDNTDGLRQRDEYDQVSSLRNSCESTGAAECSSDENAAETEITVASQPMQENCFEDDSDSSMLDSVSISNITPDVVIESIGKQHFWKVRKAILRQQRTFSVQVFELHRLIKVQKLMATSPILPINDESSDAPSGKTDNANMTSDNVEEWERGNKMNGGTQTNEQVNANPTEPGAGWLANSEAVCYQGLYNQGPGKSMNCGENGNIYAQSFPSISEPVLGGRNTWGFPHPGFGLGQWTVPMPSPPGVFMYNPFTGPFPPAAFTGSAFSSPGLTSFPSFVGASQGAQSDLRYGFPASNMHWGSPVFLLPAASPNLLSNCCSLPFSVVDPMHQAHAHVDSSVFAQNGKAGEEAGLITSEHATSGIPTPCLGAFSNEQLGSTLTKRSLTGVNRHSTHCDQIQSGLYTPQNLSNMPDRVRETYPDQAKENCGQLSEPNDFVGTNCSRSGGGKPQEVANDPSKKASKPHSEEENCTKELAYQSKMSLEKDTLALFPLLPSSGGREPVSGREHGSRVIKVVPCNPVAAPETAAGILLSIQKERQKGE